MTSDNINMMSDNDSVGDEIESLRRKLAKLEKKTKQKKSSSPRIASQELAPKQTQQKANKNGGTPNTLSDEDESSGGRMGRYEGETTSNGEDDNEEEEEEADSMRAQGRPSSKSRTSKGSSDRKKTKRPSLGPKADSKDSEKFYKYLSKSTRNLGKRDSKQNIFDGQSGRGSSALGENDSVCGMIGDSSSDSEGGSSGSDIDTSEIGQRRKPEIDNWVPLDAVHQQQLQEHIYRQQELYKQERPDDTEDLWDHPVATPGTVATKTNIATSGGSRSDSSDEFEMQDVYKATLNNPLLRPGIPQHGSYRSTSNRTGSSHTVKPYQEVETLSRYSNVSYEIKSRKSATATRSGKTNKTSTTRRLHHSDVDDDDSFSSISSSERVTKSAPKQKGKNMLFDTSEMESQRKKHSQEIMTTKQRSSFVAIMPVKITPDGEATVASNTVMPSEEDEDVMTPPFQQFSLMSADVEHLSRDLANESKFHDAGPRYTDAFTLVHSSTHFQDQYPKELTNDFIDSQSLSRFSFPDGVKLRFFPRAANDGAQRLGWLGKAADCCHVLVFTDSSGFAHYGVAITVREEYVPASKSEKLGLVKSLRVRQKRRSAATKISRWWQKIVQYRVLTEALHISGFEHHTAADLKAELSQPEMQMLEKSLRHRQISGQDLFGGGIRRVQKAGDLQKRMKNQGIRRKLNRALSDRGSGQETQRKTSRELSNEAVTAVENVTRNAIMRSPSTKFADQQGSDSHQLNRSASTRVSNQFESDDDDRTDQNQKKSKLLRVLERADRRSNKHKNSRGVTSRSVTSGSRSQKSLGFRSLRSKKSFDKPLENDGGDHVSTSRSTKRSSASVKSGLTTIKSSSTGSSSKSYSSKTIKRAKEAYEVMKAADKLGNMCVIEKCYVLVGCRPEHSAFLLGPLQQLVDYEREETHRRFRQMRHQKRRSTDSTAALEERLKIDQDRNRAEILEAMMDKLRLTRKQAYTSFPMSELHHIQGRRRHFKTNLNIPDTPGIKLPLPLPDIGKQWGVSKLLLTIGPDSLLLAVKLLLLERSMLILGKNLQEITACACGLLSLLKPMEWASAFMPVLPLSLLGFVNSPVPFVAGVAVDDNYRLMEVETDERVTQAMENGMSVINLHSSTLLLTTETGVSQMLSLDPYLREQLDFLSTRLQHYARDQSSAINSFPRFIKDGLSRKESVTLHSVSSAFEQHFVRYCGDLATSGNAWKRYGTIDVKTGNFNFYPAWFMNPIRADQFFHEALVHTQLFVGYVDERRRDQMEVDEMRKSEIGRFIANWIYEKWIARKKLVFNEFVKRRGEPIPSERESDFATSTGRTG